MIKPVSCKCPNCQADLTIENGREFAFCSYCGTKFFLQDDSVQVKYEIHREINDADIIREKAKEKIYNKKLDRDGRKEDFKRKLIVIYILACLISGLLTFFLLSNKQSSIGAFALLISILLVTFPIMIKITLSMIRYGETTVTTNTESSWFGLKKHSSQQVHSPVTTAALMWLAYVLFIWLAFTSVHPDYTFFPFFSTSSESIEETSSMGKDKNNEEAEVKIFDEDYYSNIFVDSWINTEEVGNTYAFMADGWNSYVATIMSEDTIQIQLYSRSWRDEKHPLKYEKDVCLVKTNSEQYDFSWLDSNHTAFVITMNDKYDGKTSDLRRTPFSSVDLKSKEWKNNNSSEGKTYQYQRDKWTLYKAIILADNLVKIEEWDRSFSDDKTPFMHEHDILVINTDNTNVEFKWTGEDKESCIIIFRDRHNKNWTEEEEICFAQVDTKENFWDKLFGNK